jgi:DNA-binding response OmpR family regulator
MKPSKNSTLQKRWTGGVLMAVLRQIAERLFGRVPSANWNGVELKVSKTSVKLRLARDGSMAHWGDQFLPVKGKQFDILHKLARRPGEIVLHTDLYCIIDSEYHKDHLLRQYIASIRKAFPLPYSDPHHQNGIIKTRKMEGYYLNLSSDQVEIV